DKKRGIEQLVNTAQNGKYAKYEAQYFLMTLYYNYENNPHKADEFATLLSDEFPDNPTFQRWKGRIAVKKGDYNSASKIFLDMLQKSRRGLTGYNYKRANREAHYYIGLNYFN